MTLADPRSSPLAALATADFAALTGRAGTCGDAGVQALYRPRGTGAGVLVTVLVVGMPDGPASPDRVSPPGPDRVKNSYILQVARVGADEPVSSPASGVGDLGGVVQLTPGDTFTVPGSAVGRGDKAEATLRAGPSIRLVEHAYWRCEAKGA